MQIFVSLQDLHHRHILPHVLSTPVKDDVVLSRILQHKKSKNDVVTNVKKRSKFDQETSAACALR